MAVQQLARLLAPTFHTDAAQQQLVCTQLVLQLGDADTGVAADAESALAAWVGVMSSFPACTYLCLAYIAHGH